MLTFQAALAGSAAPWAICAALVLTTLLLEDLAIAAGVAVAAHGALTWPLSFAAVAGGIAIGDIGLYGLGLAATRAGWLQRRFVPARCDWAREQLLRRLPSAVLLARVIPGLRVLTYTACGFLRVPLWPFGVWVSLAVLLWTGNRTGTRQHGIPPPHPNSQWVADPTGRHQYRLWDGQRWSPHVSDDGRAGYDPI